MSIGTGIFLSSIVLAIVILYGLTKDRWPWRRFVRRTALFFLGLLIVGGAAIASWYFWEQMPANLVRQTEYAGVRLGMSPDEVMYIKGYPESILTEELNDPKWKGFYNVVKTKDLEKGTQITDYNYWVYDSYEHSINVVFNKQRTAVVAISCYSNDRLYRCPPVGGLRDGDSEKEALRKLGQPSESKIQGLTKSLDYRDLGVKLTLTKETIGTIAISSLSGHQD